MVRGASSDRRDSQVRPGPYLAICFLPRFRDLRIMVSGPRLSCYCRSLPIQTAPGTDGANHATRFLFPYAALHSV
eukprot:2505770-Rhodomonas_salina.1